VKSSLSFDGLYLASGSSDSNIFLWEVKHPERPAVLLEGHTNEVTEVCWDIQSERLGSISDNGNIKMHSSNLELAEKFKNLEQNETGKLQLFGAVKDPLENEVFENDIVNNAQYNHPLHDPEATQRHLRDFFKSKNSNVLTPLNSNKNALLDDCHARRKKKRKIDQYFNRLEK
jgi:WD40 repeat protein